MFFKAKSNSIKKKLVVSYIALILTVGLFVSLIYYVYSLSMLEKQTFRAAQSIRKLAKINLKLHKDYLEPLAEKFVLSEAEHTANELSGIILMSGGYSLEKFQNNKIIRSIVTKKIEAKNKYIGDLIVVDEDEDIIMSSDKTMENHNYHDIKDRYKGLYKLVDSGLKKNEFHGYYTANPLKTDTGNIYRKFLAGVRIPDSPLYVISSIYVQPYMTPILEKINKMENNEINILTANMQNLKNNSVTTLLIISLLLFLLLIFISTFIANWLAMKISNPIVSLKNAVLKIGQGNFDTQVKEHGTDETIQLAKTFNKLGNCLKGYIDNLAREIEQRKLVESEIQIAKNIQQSLLPAVTEDLIRPEFSIYANLIPAKEVAGDFYDFFYINKEKTRLAVILGDVSGKGIPAAFFMGIVRTLLKNTCLTLQPENPAILLKEVNNLICSDNTECMFVTLFVAFYDIPSSIFTYANAGHHAAIKLNSNSDIEEFGTLDDTLLGLFPAIEYKSESITLKSDESVFLYTDGISEATSPSKELYEVERIENMLKNTNDLPPNEICKTLLKDVMEFQEGVIFDDMTVLILKKLN